MQRITNTTTHRTDWPENSFRIPKESQADPEESDGREVEGLKEGKPGQLERNLLILDLKKKNSAKTPSLYEFYKTAVVDAGMAGYCQFYYEHL